MANEIQRRRVTGSGAQAIGRANLGSVTPDDQLDLSGLLRDLGVAGQKFGEAQSKQRTDRAEIAVMETLQKNKDLPRDERLQAINDTKAKFQDEDSRGLLSKIFISGNPAVEAMDMVHGKAEAITTTNTIKAYLDNNPNADADVVDSEIQKIIEQGLAITGELSTQARKSYLEKVTPFAIAQADAAMARHAAKAKARSISKIVNVAGLSNNSSISNIDAQLQDGTDARPLRVDLTTTEIEHFNQGRQATSTPEAKLAVYHEAEAARKQVLAVNGSSSKDEANAAFMSVISRAAEDYNNPDLLDAMFLDPNNSGKGAELNDRFGSIVQDQRKKLNERALRLEAQLQIKRRTEVSANNAQAMTEWQETQNKLLLLNPDDAEAAAEHMDTVNERARKLQSDFDAGTYKGNESAYLSESRAMAFTYKLASKTATTTEATAEASTLYLAGDLSPQRWSEIADKVDPEVRRDIGKGMMEDMAKFHINQQATLSAKKTSDTDSIIGEVSTMVNQLSDFQTANAKQITALRSEDSLLQSNEYVHIDPARLKAEFVSDLRSFTATGTMSNPKTMAEKKEFADRWSKDKRKEVDSYLENVRRLDSTRGERLEERKSAKEFQSQLSAEVIGNIKENNPLSPEVASVLREELSTAGSLKKFGVDDVGAERIVTNLLISEYQEFQGNTPPLISSIQEARLKLGETVNIHDTDGRTNFIEVLKAMHTTGHVAQDRVIYINSNNQLVSTSKAKILEAMKSGGKYDLETKAGREALKQLNNESQLKAARREDNLSGGFFKNTTPVFDLEGLDAITEMIKADKELSIQTFREKSKKDKEKKE